MLGRSPPRRAGDVLGRIRRTAPTPWRTASG